MRYTLLLVLLQNLNGIYGDETCFMEMFDSDFVAFMACRTQFAHQSNWFPSPIAGLFSYLSWNGYNGFWQNGLILEPMVNFMAYANHTRFNSVVKVSHRRLESLLEAYGPYPSFDDIGWFGLSFTRTYEVLGIQSFLDTAVDIFDWAWETGWDHTGRCSGGFWFDDQKRSKQSITNLIYLQLAARVFRITKNPMYFEKMELIFNYISDNRLLNQTTYLISDGATAYCGPNQIYGPTYLAGTMIGGLVEMYRISKGKPLIDLAIKIANATILNSTSKSGVFTEYCEPKCNRDQIVFRGIFVRNLRYLMDVLEFGDFKLRQWYQKWLDFNGKVAINNAMCDKKPLSECHVTYRDGPPYYNVSGPIFGPYWSGPFTFGAPEQQTVAFELFVSGIKPETRCKGRYCNFDPYFPSPPPLTCFADPCPFGEECCVYKSGPFVSYSCCSRSQRCNKKGICV